jgi:hypothetical protein
LAATNLAEVNAGGPAQVVSFGPNNVKVIVPVGFTPPDKVALSVIVPPAATGSDADVATAVFAWETATVSAAQALATGLSLASPL